MKKLGVALQVKGLALMVPGCVEIWQATEFPEAALIATVLASLGILVFRRAG